MSKLDFLKEGQKGIDGGDVGAIMNLGEKNIYEIYCEKTSEIIQVPEETEAEYWDTRLKNLVAMEFVHRTDKKLRRENKQLVSREYPFMIANIYRRVVGENAIFECFNDVSDGRIAKSYILKCQHNLAVSGCEKCYIAVFNVGKKLVIKELLRDEGLIQNIISSEKVFWEDYVEKRICPPVKFQEK